MPKQTTNSGDNEVGTFEIIVMDARVLRVRAKSINEATRIVKHKVNVENSDKKIPSFIHSAKKLEEEKNVKEE